jgi:hypothetical protein
LNRALRLSSNVGHRFSVNLTEFRLPVCGELLLTLRKRPGLPLVRTLNRLHRKFTAGNQTTPRSVRGPHVDEPGRPVANHHHLP